MVVWPKKRKEITNNTNRQFPLSLKFTKKYVTVSCTKISNHTPFWNNKLLQFSVRSYSFRPKSVSSIFSNLNVGFSLRDTSRQSLRLKCWKKFELIVFAFVGNCIWYYLWWWSSPSITRLMSIEFHPFRISFDQADILVIKIDNRNVFFKL